MKVADSSYLVEAILRDATLIENETFLAPDLALCEVVNTLWKHEVLIGDEGFSSPHQLTHGINCNGSIQLLRPDKKLLEQAFAISAKHRLPIYDTTCIALPLQLALELKTYDTKQSSILLREKRSQNQ